MSLSSHCEAKVRAACEVFPSQEWSGAAFYKYAQKESGTTSMTDTELVIMDLCLQDIGNGVYTEYSLDGDTAAYYAEHIDTLLGCKVMLLHSHNMMTTYFSGTDMATLREQAKQCNNVFSVIVNNDGTYNAKFTEKHVIHKDSIITTQTTETDQWSYMGEKEDCKTRDYSHEDTEHEEYVEIKCWDCDVERPLDVSPDEDFKQECIEKIDLFKRRKEVYKPVSSYTSDWLWRDSSDNRSMWKPNEKDTEIDCMTNSILNLSFTNTRYHRHVIDDNLNGDFLERFLDAWEEYFLPNADDLNEVMNKISMYGVETIHPNAKRVILDYLTIMWEDYTYNEEEN